MGAGQGAEELDDDDTGDNDDTGEGGDEFGDSFDAERAKTTILAQREAEKKARKELRTERKARQDLETRLKQLEDSGKEPDEKLAQEVQDFRNRAEKAEARVRKATLRESAISEAAKLRFTNPALAARLIDVDEVEWDGDEPSNVKELLREVLRDNPSLKARTSTEDDEDEGADGGAGRRGRSGGGRTMNDMIRGALVR
jgi:hypothetical protein